MTVSSSVAHGRSRAVGRRTVIPSPTAGGSGEESTVDVEGLHSNVDGGCLVASTKMELLGMTVWPGTRLLRMTTIGFLALLCAISAAAQTPPPLPELPLDSYEPTVREPISEAYEEARAHPDDAARVGILGMVLYAHEQYEFAAPCFERAHAIDPGEGRWAYYRGRAQLYLGDHEAAAASLAEALRLRPGYLPAEVMRAQALLEAGRVDESLALYEGLAAAHPDVAEIHYGLGRIHAQRGEPAPAAEHLRRACELFPAFGAAHFALARVYRDLGEREKAREHLALYQEDKTGWPTLDDPLLADIVAMRTSATDHLRRGIQLAEHGQLGQAAEAHEAALEADPTLVQAHVNLIRIYGQLDEGAKVEEHYRAAVELDPNRAEIHYNYGVFLAGHGRSDEAAEAFRRALELNPSYAEAHNNYAYLLMTSGKLDEAARHYRTAIEEKPDYRIAHFNLARILVNQGKLDEAIDHLRHTLTPEDEETPRFTYALAVALGRAERYHEALGFMEEARQKATAFGQTELLGSIERDLGALQRMTGSR
jgi:tetratricopeptide (TPR) repeat protein